jgi:hypothetical protein
MDLTQVYLDKAKYSKGDNGSTNYKPRLKSVPASGYFCTFFLLARNSFGNSVTQVERIEKRKSK